jgi:hypothetical protein
VLRGDFKPGQVKQSSKRAKVGKEKKVGGRDEGMEGEVWARVFNSVNKLLLTTGSSCEWSDWDHRSWGCTFDSCHGCFPCGMSPLFFCFL